MKEEIKNEKRNELETESERLKLNKKKLNSYQDNRTQQEIYYSNLNKKEKEKKLIMETLIIMFFGWLSGMITSLSVLWTT